MDERPGAFGGRVVLVLVLSKAGEDPIGFRRARQAVLHLVVDPETGTGIFGALCLGKPVGIAHELGPERPVAPDLVQRVELVFVDFCHVFDIAAGLAKERGNPGFLVVEPRAEARVLLAFGSDEQVHEHRVEDGFTGGFARGVFPVVQSLDRAGQRIGDDVVFHRAEQHVRDGRDEGDQDKDQKRRDEHEGAHLLPPQRPSQRGLEGPAVGGKHRSVLGRVAHDRYPEVS